MGGRPEAPIAISPQIRGADLGVWLEGSLSSQSGEPFRLMVESVIDYAVFMLDSQGRIATWNKGAERIKGYSAEQIVGKHFSIFYSPADIESGLPERMLAIATQLGRHEGEGWRLRKSGESFWANVVITALLDDTGKLVGFGKFTQDLTERRKAEHEIRTAQEHLRLMVEATADYAMIMLDPQGIVVTWNKGAERIKGYTANAILGQHFSVFYPREAIESGRPDRELVTAAEQGRYEDEGWRVRKGGSRFWANVVVTALRDETGKLVGFGKVTRDLTERRRTEQGLEAAYDQLNSVLECTSDSVFKINRDWILVYGNRKATESLPDFTLGRSYWDCFPAARGTFIEEILRTAMKMRSSASYENYYAPYQQWYRGNIYPTDDGLSIFFTNITEEKALKEKAEREQFLKEKRIEALSHMAGGLAHEISNPLAIIHARASDLFEAAEGADALSSADVRKASQSIVKTADRAMKILRGLRGFGREANKDPMELASVYQIVDQCLEIQQSRLERHGVEFRLHLEPDIPAIECRETQIGQILTNLLNNAFDAVMAGGGEKHWIEMAACLADGCLRLEVTDSGPGIAENIKAHLMEPFFTTKEIGLGMGVGLSLSRAIAQEHGGTLALYDDSQYTRFRLVLPLRQNSGV